MIETVAGEVPIEAGVTLPDAVAQAFSELAGRLVSRSQIVWGEHCSECGYPLCYSSCAFYSPRSDLHCRRFAAGIETVGRAPRGTSAFRIRFRKWGKLEGAGPVAMRAPSAVAAVDRVDVAASRLLAGTPMPYGVRRSLGARWNHAKGRVLRTGKPLAGETAFVVEAWSADGKNHPFTVTFLPPPGHAGGMHQEKFEATPEYGRTVIPVSRIAAQVDLEKPFLVQIEPVGDAAGRDVVFGMCDFASFAGELPSSVRAKPKEPKAAPGTPPKAKVVVWDLDETLWRGILAESGVEGVTLKEEITAIIRALDERGIVQSIASKNNLDEALAALKSFGLADYFLYPQVGWGPKSDAVRRIAKSLDLGIDSFVFVDDQPFERNEVQEAHPTVRVLPETAIPDLLAHPWFDIPVTAESRKRRAMYQEEAGRNQAFAESGTDYTAFLRGCNIVLELRPLGSADAERVHELSQRTNQLNFTGARLSRDDVARLSQPSQNQVCVTMRCTDRFGEYGLIGFAVIDLDTGFIMEFFMSCRVQRKRVEQAFFAHAAALVAARGHQILRARFKKTARNSTAVTMLEELGFTLAPGGGEPIVFERPVATPVAESDVVRLVDAAPSVEPALERAGAAQ